MKRPAQFLAQGRTMVILHAFGSLLMLLSAMIVTISGERFAVRAAQFLPLHRHGRGLQGHGAVPLTHPQLGPRRGAKTPTMIRTLVRAMTSRTGSSSGATPRRRRASLTGEWVCMYDPRLPRLLASLRVWGTDSGTPLSAGTLFANTAIGSRSAHGLRSLCYLFSPSDESDDASPPSPRPSTRVSRMPTSTHPTTTDTIHTGTSPSSPRRTSRLPRRMGTSVMPTHLTCRLRIGRVGMGTAVRAARRVDPDTGTRTRATWRGRAWMRTGHSMGICPEIGRSNNDSRPRVGRCRWRMRTHVSGKGATASKCYRAHTLKGVSD